MEPKDVNVVFAASSNYVITNPHRGLKCVYRGPYAFGFGYPLEKLGEDITGKDYKEVKLTLSESVQAVRFFAGVIELGLLIGSGGASSTLSVNWSWNGNVNAFLSPDIWSVKKLGRPFQTSNAEWWRDFYNYIPKEQKTRYAVRNSTGAGMFIWMPPASQTWSAENYRDMMDAFDRPDAEIIWSVLNDDNHPGVSSSDIESRLLASNCEGIFNEVNQSTHAPYNKVNIFSKVRTNSNGENGYEDCGSDRDKLKLYNGMDWMLIYNFYRIIDYKSLKEYESKFKAGQSPGTPWKPFNGTVSNDYLREPMYTNNFCPCKSSYGFYSDRDVPLKDWLHDNNSHITALPFTPTITRHKGMGELPIRVNAYKNYGLYLTDWLTQNFTINNTGILKPEGDLTICNSKVSIENGGTLSTDNNTDAEFPKLIKVSKNASIEIKSGGTLYIENNTQVIIEEGAKLIFHNGAHIVLNGTNSVLKFEQSQLELKSGAIFGIEAGPDGRGYVHFHNNWKTSNDPANIICENNTTKFKISGTHSDYSSYANDLILKVTGNVGIVTDWKLKHFIVEQGFVAMGKDSRISSNAEFTQFRKCVVNVLSNASEDLYNKHNGIQIPGRLNDFTEVDINNCNVGIRYYNRGGQEVLKMNQCMIRNAVIGIDQWGGGFNIAGSQFAAKNKCINTRYGTTISKLRNNMINGGVRAGFTSSSVGVDYASSSNLYAWKNYVKNVGTGFKVLDASARFKCNTMQENSRNLVWIRASYINLYEGYNSFIGSSSTHILGRGDTYFGLVDGYNLFENPTLNNHPFIFDAIISTRSPIFDYSLDGGNNGYGSTFKAFPDPDQNYQLQMIDNSSITYDLILKTTPNLYSSITTTISDNCTEIKEFKSFDYKGTTYTNFNNDQGGASPTQFYSKPFKPVNNTMVKVSDISNDRLGPIIKRNFERILVPTNTTIDTLINEISRVFKLNYQRQDLKDSSNAIDMKIGYDLLTSAYIYSAFKDNGDSSEGMFDKAALYYPKMDSTFQNLWTQSSDTNNVWSLHRYQIAMDWAQINRIANNKTKAIAILDSGMMLMEDSLHIKGLAGWKCVNQLEIALQADTSLTLDSAIANCDCEIQPKVNVDTMTVDTKDTTIHYCHWDVPNLKVSKGYKWNGTTQYLTSVENTHNDYETYEISDSSEYWFKNGDYRLTYFDSTIGKVNVWNVKIVADTQVITVADNAVSYCDRSHYGKTSYYEYVPYDTLPYNIINKALNQKVNSNLLKEGDYRIVTYDTSNCSISWNNLTVNADTMVVQHLSDTSISKSTIAIFYDDLVESINVHNYPYSIELTGMEPDSLSFDDSLTNLSVNIDFIDTANCRILRKKADVLYFKPTILTSDTTIYRCAEDSAYFLDIESIPIVSLYDHSVYQVYPDSALIYGDSFIMSGVYVISLFDTDNSVLKLLRLNFVDSLVCDTIPGPMMLGLDQTKRLKLNIYPNPANSELNFSLNMKQSILSIKLYDMQGKEVLCKFISDPETNHYKLDVSELSEGNYIVQLVSDSTVYQQKIQINR
ncbi:MAG TPA: T9SS type A sorting domain-containing protein [Bacteroidia bacterium]